jgi:hypothetical protein
LHWRLHSGRCRFARRPPGNEHQQFASELQRRYPKATVEMDRIFIAIIV